jgi:hypothetical protein
MAARCAQGLFREGRLRGVTLKLGVVPNANFGLMRGAVVVLGEF